MEKIYVVYWSQTGNTQAMAEAIGEGVTQAGKEVCVCSVNEVTADDLKEAQVFAMGCPAMGAEELEESEMEPFVKSLEDSVSGKRILLFGSYGWGDGEWMREWTARMKEAGAVISGGEELICQDMPDEEMLKKCREMGKGL